MSNDTKEETEESFRENEDAVEEPRRPGVERKLSTSESAEYGSSGRLTAPKWLNWMEYPFRVQTPSTGQFLKESTGWTMDAVGRGIVNQGGSFVGPALLRSAFVDAECTTADCTNTVYGLKPSSLLTFAAAMVGIIAAVVMPFVGAVVDHTHHRKTVGMVSGFLIVIITGIQISITEDNWFFILILESIGAFFTLVHIAAVLAYLADLTTLESDLAHLTSRFNIVQYIGQLLFVTTIIVITEVEDADVSVESTVRTARQALCIAFVVSFLLIPYAWIFLFRKRPALSEVPEGANLLTAGFVKVFRTSKKIWKKYRALKWFMISLLASPESGAGSLLTITVTFMTVHLELTSQEIGFVTLVFMGSTLPGAILAKYLCLKINPLNTYRVGLFVLGAVAVGTFLSLPGPEAANGIYPWVVFWGLSVGCIYPSQRVLFVSLIPKGQETEMMGLFTFAGQLLGWIPPVVFTALNQRGVSMEISAQVVSVICFIAVFLTLPMGSYRKAVEAVAPDVAAEDSTISQHELQGMKTKESGVDDADVEAVSA